MSVWKLDEKLLILESLISPTKILLFEKYYQAFDTVFHHKMKNLDVRQKNTPLYVVFLTLFSVFHLVMRHCVSCVIYYIKFQIKYFEGSRLIFSFFRFWLNFDVILYTANGSTNCYTASCLHQCQFNSSCVGSPVQNDYGGNYWSRWSLLSSLVCSSTNSGC